MGTMPMMMELRSLLLLWHVRHRLGEGLDARLDSHQQGRAAQADGQGCQG
jgi:hypothetical protein